MFDLAKLFKRDEKDHQGKLLIPIYCRYNILTSFLDPHR